ncbi:hypothetical protein, partial [Bacteroides thetaiotaomicron]
QSSKAGFRQTDTSRLRSYTLLAKLKLDKNKKMTEKQIVWYILLTEVKIDSDTQSVTSLSVAPLAVLPEFQRKGIGGGC